MSVAQFVEILGIVLLFLAAIKCPEPPHASFGWFGVFLLALVVFVPAILK